MSYLKCNEVLTVHPAELNFPLELNKKNSCSIQLTNKTNELVAYRFRLSSTLVVSPEFSDVGTILPHSTCSVTVTVKLRNNTFARNVLHESICILAFLADYGVKARDLTKENFYAKTYQTRGYLSLLVVFANSSAAVPEKNEKGSLLDDNNSLQLSDNEEMERVENSPPPAELVIPTTGGHGSTSPRKSEDTRVKPNFKPFFPEEIHDATNNFSQSLMIGEGGYGKVYKCQLDNWDVAVKILDDQGGQGLKEYIKDGTLWGALD